MPDQTSTLKPERTSAEQTSRFQITSGLLHYGKLFHADGNMCIVYVSDKDRERKSERDSTMFYDELPVYVCVCVCIFECVCV